MDKLTKIIRDLVDGADYSGDEENDYMRFAVSGFMVIMIMLITSVNF
jgi:hypothetical protein